MVNVLILGLSMFILQITIPPHSPKKGGKGGFTVISLPNDYINEPARNIDHVSNLLALRERAHLFPS